MKKRRITFGLVAVMLAVTMLTGCATVKSALGQKSAGQALIVSGESLVFVSKQFESAGKEFTARCAATATKRLSAETCNGFNAFGEKFKEVWPHVTATWRVAVKARDAVMQTDTEKIANDLYAELLKYIAGLAGGLSLAPATDMDAPFYPLLFTRLELTGGR